MFLFVLAIIAALIAVAGWFVARATKRRLAQPNVSSYEQENLRIGQLVGRAALAVGVVAAVLCGFFSSFTTVPANNVGIVTAFGRPTGTVSSGAHMLAPWDSVDTYSTQIQVTQRLAGPQGDTPSADCVQVNQLRREIVDSYRRNWTRHIAAMNAAIAWYEQNPVAAS